MLGANKWSVFIRVSKHCFCFGVILVQVLSLVQSTTFASGVELSRRTSLESKPIASKIPYHVSSVLLLSVLPNDHNRDIAGRNWVKHWYAEYLRIILIHEMKRQ